MKVIEWRKGGYVSCPHCTSILLVEEKDLMWSHVEPNCYYVTCPECNTTIWIESDEFYNNMWKDKLNRQKQTKKQTKKAN